MKQISDSGTMQSEVEWGEVKWSEVQYREGEEGTSLYGKGL